MSDHYSEDEHAFVDDETESVSVSAFTDVSPINKNRHSSLQSQVARESFGIGENDEIDRAGNGSNDKGGNDEVARLGSGSNDKGENDEDARLEGGCNDKGDNDETTRVEDGSNDEGAKSRVVNSMVAMTESGNQPVVRDLTEWTEHTHSQLSLALSLREELSQKMFSPLHNQSMAESGISNAGQTARIEQLKKEIHVAENHNRILFYRIEQTSHTIQHASACVARLLRVHKEKQAPLKVVEKRLQLRSQRPPSECVQDNVQDALDKEKSTIVNSSSELARQIGLGHKLLRSLEDIKAQLIDCVQHEREIVKLDRSCLLFDGFHCDGGDLKRKEKAVRSKLQSGAMGGLRELIDTSTRLQDENKSFASESDTILKRIKRVIEQAAVATNTKLKARIADTAELKRKLEKECYETSTMIKRLQQSLEIMREQLKGNTVRPPKLRSKLSIFLEQSTDRIDLDSLDLFDDLGSGGLTQVTLDKAMAAAGDKSGLIGLQQAERILAPHADVVRIALERIAEELSSDTRSGEVSRKLKQLMTKVQGQQECIESELAVIRDTKASVTEALNERVKWGGEKLEIMVKETLPALEADLRCKTAAWKIDSMCQRVSITNVEGDGADTAPKSPGKPQRPIPYSPPLKPETLEKLKELTRAASYTGQSGCELDVVFNRVDKDHSGFLDEDELRMALRRLVRVPTSVISDAQISSLCKLIDREGTGSVRIPDLVDFLGAEPEVSKRTGRPFHGPMLQGAAGTTLPEVIPHVRKQKLQNSSPRPYRPPLKKSALQEIRKAIKSAAYAGVFGKQLDVIFGRFDTDGSGQLEDNELKQALRCVLKIPPSVLSDPQIYSLCATLDKDCSGSVSIQELIDFVGRDPAVSQRTGRKSQTTLEEAAEFLEKESRSLPLVL